MSSALILFAHGARDPEWATPIRRVRAAIEATDSSILVELAFLEFMSPGLAGAADVLVECGATEIVILPMFIAQGGHLKREVPEMLAALQAAHPAVRFKLASAIGEAPAVIAAMATAALSMLRS